MGTLLSALLSFFRARVPSRATLAMEDTALHQQLTIYQRNQKHPRLRTGDRAFWVVLRKLLSAKDRSLIIVRPETVIASHRQDFRLFWHHRSTSREVGCPRIPREQVAFIHRISGDHPEWGEDKIADEFDSKFGIHHSASTIRRYTVRRTDGSARPRPGTP